MSISVGWWTTDAANRANAGAFGVDEDLGLVPLRRPERLLSDLQRPAHAETPTWTPRKRAGDAPCET